MAPKVVSPALAAERTSMPAGAPPPPATASSSSTEASDAAPAVTKAPKAASSGGAPAAGSIVDMEVFGQLLEIDDDESHEFSRTLAFDYIQQAEVTFTELDAALDQRDLDTLSRKGHFLKGSSAALGLTRVQHSCEAMQHYGNKKEANGDGSLSEDEALENCRKLLATLRQEQKEGKEWLEKFYG